MKVRRLDYYPDEYIVGVSRMTFEHQGVYWMVCSLIMSHGGPIENDPKWIGKLGGMGAAKCRNIISDLIAHGKLAENCGKIGQKRAETELKHAQKRIETAQKNGSKGGRPPSENNDLAEPDGLSGEKLTTNYQLPTTNYSVSKDTAAAQRGVDLKKAAYDHGKLILGKAGGGRITQAIARIGLAGTIEALEQTRRENPIDPNAYFTRAVSVRAANSDQPDRPSEGYGCY